MNSSIAAHVVHHHDHSWPCPLLSVSRRACPGRHHRGFPAAGRSAPLSADPIRVDRRSV